MVRAQACWRWSRRRGVLAGFSASALHGSQWVDAARLAEVIYDNRHAAARIWTYSDRIGEDEISVIGGIRVTTPARTALEPRQPASFASCRRRDRRSGTGDKTQDGRCRAARSALSRKTRYQAGSSGVGSGRSRCAAPKETWLRLLLIKAGFPRPQTRSPSALNSVGLKPIWIWAGRRSR